MPARSSRQLAAIDGGGVLYHFLQKDLLKRDVWLFQMFVARLVASLGIWFRPSLYRQWPLLVPYSVRDPHSRGNRKLGIGDQWGTPNEAGYFRDDNSLIKKLPGSLRISSPTIDVYDGRAIGNGFVASHVWRVLAPESSDVELASRDPLTYSFIPNLVWLPSSVASLTDREGSFAQTYLQALSMKLYREAPVSGDMRSIVERAWAKLPSPTGIPADGLPDEDELNFFDDTTQFVKRRRRTVEVVVEALRLIEAGSPLPRKVVSRRYTEGLPSVARPPLRELAAHLSSYLAASTDEVGTDI